VSDLLIGVLAAALATNQAAALSNLVQKQTGIALTVPDKNDPVEREYQKLLEMDDEAQADVDKWIKDQQANAEKGIPNVSLDARIQQRFDPVKKAYETFLLKNPNHARARLAYGSFLNDIHEESEGVAQWEKARELDPKEPAAWNNLANYYGHNGPIEKAFEYYSKAIELKPNESLYYENFATTVYLFRRDATNYFKINEQQVFDKAMGLYRKAQELDPNNFVLASDIAQTYYGIILQKGVSAQTNQMTAQKWTKEALAAWRKAYDLARDDIERQGVLVHFARVELNAGMFEEARKNLQSVTNDMFKATKKNLLRKLEKQQSGGDGSNEKAAEPPRKSQT